MVDKLTMKSTAPNFIWQRVKSVDGFCSPFHMLQQWVLSSSGRHFTSHISGRFRVLLDILQDTEKGVVEFYSTFYKVQKLEV